MKEPDKITIELTKSQLFDLEFIAKVKRMKKEEWALDLLSHEIQDTKEQLLAQLEKEFITGKKSREEYIQFIGFEPNNELEERRNQYEKKMEMILKGTKHREFASRALLDGIRNDH